MTVSRRRGLSIQAVLVVAFVLVATTAIVFLSIQRYLWVTGDLLVNDLRADTSLAKLAASGLTRYMEQRTHLVTALGTDLGGVGLDRPVDVQRDLERVIRRNPSITAVFVTDAGGIVRVAVPERDTANRPNVGKRFDDRQWFKDALAGARPSYEIVISRGTTIGRPAMPVTAPLRSPRGEIVGVVAAEVNLDGLRKSFEDFGDGHDRRLVVVDVRGRIIFHSVAEWEAQAKDLSAEEVFRAAQRESTGSVHYVSSLTGKPGWGSYARVAGTGWVVWVPRDEERWGPRVQGLLRDLALSALVAVLIAAAAAFVLSRALSQPLRLLVDAAGHVAARRFDSVLLTRPRSRIREFAELFTGFGAMAESLRALYLDLEGKVVDRTRALEASARAAEASAAQLRAHDEIRQGYAELAGLLNSLDRSHILEESTKKIAGSLHAVLAAVYLSEDGPEDLRLKTYTTLDGGLMDAAMLGASGVPRAAAVRGETIVVAPGAASPGLRLQTGAGVVDVAAVVATPLTYQARLLGVLVVALLEPPGDEVRSFLDSAARQLSVALSNAGLFESVRSQSQQLEHLNVELKRTSDVKSQFLASMSHELRTPLNSIIGFTEVLLGSTRDPLSDRQRAALEKVRGSGRHLLGLINDVLDLSKVEAGRMDVRPERFTLDTLVAECLATVEPQAHAKGLALSMRGADTAPPMLQDRAKLKQILVNLLSNAVKFTDRGAVTVSVRREPDDRVAIAVTDTGRGIRAEDQALVFEAFRQAAPTETSGSEGTGLGLAITRRLAELLGGTLGLDSAPDRGSVFTLLVPTRYELVGAGPDGTQSAAGGAPVLVIDDNRDVADIIQRAIADDGMTVDWAATARDGLARARARIPAAIVLDVMLQGFDDGWDVLAALKGDEATRGIPVLVHSAIDNPDRARALGADAVLVKPAIPARIATTLRTLVRGAVSTTTGPS